MSENNEEVIQEEQIEPSVDPCLIKIEDLPKGKDPYKKINNKPFATIFSILILGIVIWIFVPKAWPLSVFMIVLALIALIFAKSYIQFEFYDDYFVIYPEKKDGTCLKIKWDDVVEWTTSEAQGSSHALTLQLKNPNRVKLISINSVGTVSSVFNKKIGNLETGAKQREAIRKKTAEWKWFWQKKNKGDE